MPSPKKSKEGTKKPSAIIHRVILGIVALIDVAGIVWLLTNDVSKLALRRGLRVDGTMIGILVVYLVILAAISVFGIVRITQFMGDPNKANAARKSRLTQISELLLLVGLMSVLVGAFILAPGTAPWLVVLAIVLMLVGGVLATAGLSLTAAKFALLHAPRKASGDTTAA